MNMVCMAAVCAPMCETTGSFTFKKSSYLGGEGVKLSFYHKAY